MAGMGERKIVDPTTNMRRARLAESDALDEVYVKAVESTHRSAALAEDILGKVPASTRAKGEPAIAAAQVHATLAVARALLALSVATQATAGPVLG
jgi:hypothetical protein